MNWLRRHGKELAIGLIGALILLTVYLTGMTYSSYMAVVREERQENLLLISRAVSMNLQNFFLRAAAEDGHPHPDPRVSGQL